MKIMNSSCDFCKRVFSKRYSSQRFCSVLCSNRFNLNNKNLVFLPEYCEELAEFFGILLGDGSVTKYFTKVYLNAIADVDYKSFVENLAQSLFKGASVTVRRRLEQGTIDIQISSRDVCDYLRKIGFDPRIRKVPPWIFRRKTFIAATVRGLFDTEGCVSIKYFRGKGGNYFYKQLTVTNANKNILAFLEKSLIMLGYKPTKNSKKNIYISNRKDIEKYLYNIGSHNPKILYKLKVEELKNFTYGGLRRMVRHQS